VDPGGGAVKVMPMPHSLGCIVPSSQGGFLAAMGVHADGTGGRLVRVTPRDCAG